ncbi:MAG: DUF177 domain-containing protein [Candidatus Omnitrophica bacterium]|nr:DUF177 domain-containing protein [Candidatus Omnitrophota bacterium]
MRIYIKNIRPEGTEINEKFSAEKLELAEVDGVEIKEPLEVFGTVEKSGETVIVRLKTSGKFSFACSRCLEPVDKVLEKEVFLDYAIDRTMLFIDIADDIRQEVMLNFPEKVLCRKDCRGICPDCGANLNAEKCRCRKK